MTMQRDKRSSAQGRTIAKRRRMCGLTQHALADAARMPVSRIVFIETGRTDPAPSELDAIRAALRQRLKEVNKEVRAEVCV